MKTKEEIIEILKRYMVGADKPSNLQEIYQNKIADALMIDEQAEARERVVKANSFLIKQGYNPGLSIHRDIFESVEIASGLKT